DEKLKAEKRARSELKRQEAMKARVQLSKSRDRLVGLELKDVDVEKKNKKIIFDSDSDEETKKMRIWNDEEEGKTNGKKKKENKLFESDDDEAEEIVFKNRHTGEQGIKLMEREAGYGHDNRFKLNDKFAESEDDEKDDEELVGEKEGALSVLAKVLGKEIKRQKLKRRVNARPFTRFDPDNEEHVQWMKENMPSNRLPLNRTWSPLPSSPWTKPAPRTIHSLHPYTCRFFEMGGDFARELKDKMMGKKEEPFFFLSSIGRNELAEERNEEDVEQKEEIMEKKKIMKDVVNDPMGFESPSMGFFFDVFALGARSVVANFRRTQSIDKVKEKWSAQRESIVKAYKNQRRFAVKNSKDEKKGFEKKEGGMFKKNDE
ncbi:hypothetical protein PFISCL1PPCAC_15600, partial [Pristionchus fissidentatus]